MTFRTFIIASCLALASLPAVGQEFAKGPAAQAVLQWYRTDPKIVCAGPGGDRIPCDVTLGTKLVADYSPDGQHALAFATWTTDPTGNSVASEVALLKNTGGTWRKIRDIKTYGTVSEAEVRWTAGAVAFETAVLKPNDSRCCPTGRKRYSVGLVGTNLSQPRPTPVRASVSVGDLYDHNGSRMIVDEKTGTITYDRPKASLAAVVKPGTVLYRGTMTLHGDIQGTAFAFKPGCPAAPYVVRGRVEYRKIVLRGAGPVRQGCDVVGYSETSPHATLRFNWIVASPEDFGNDT